MYLLSLCVDCVNTIYTLFVSHTIHNDVDGILDNQLDADFVWAKSACATEGLATVCIGKLHLTPPPPPLKSPPCKPPPGGGLSLHCLARQDLLRWFVFPICHTHVLALLSHYFESVNCVYFVRLSLKGGVQGVVSLFQIQDVSSG